LAKGRFPREGLNWRVKNTQALCSFMSMVPERFVIRRVWLQRERPKGDRKGPHSTQPCPRLYYDYEVSSQARS